MWDFSECVIVTVIALACSSAPSGSICSSSERVCSVDFSGVLFSVHGEGERCASLHGLGLVGVASSTRKVQGGDFSPPRSRTSHIILGIENPQDVAAQKQDVRSLVVSPHQTSEGRSRAHFVDVLHNIQPLETRMVVREQFLLQREKPEGYAEDVKAQADEKTS